ncbi:glycoside hydrolase family 10 protein [Longibacter salinarum]|nr:family 10 glycosylhydrolase [Longibacter salinarum]
MFPRSASWVAVVALLVLTAAACDSGGDGPSDPDTQVALSFAPDASYVVGNDVGVTATVTTVDGDPVEGDTVAFSGDGSFQPSTGTTDADGEVVATWTLATDKTGADAQFVRVETAKGKSDEQSVSVNPGAVGSITATVTDTVIAVDSTTTLSVVDAADEFGNSISDLSRYTFSWTSVTPDSAAIEGDSVGTEVTVRGLGDGMAHFSVSSGAAPDASVSDIQKAEKAAATEVDVDVRRHELRGVWLTNVDSNVLDSRANIREAMEYLEANNFNVVFPVVWNKAATMYPSTVMDTLLNRPIDPAYAGRDPLQEIIDEAKPRGIAVIPWFEFGFSSSYSQNGGPIIDKYPSWAAKDVNGDLLVKNGFDWMNPYRPEVQNLLMSLIMEVVNNYDIDGIQGDDRLPANPVEGGYSEYTKELYRSEHNGQNPPTNEQNPDWKKWRADKLTAFGERVYNNVKGVDSDLIVSWSPSPYSFGYDEYLQDYPEWVDRGITDIAHPQLYRRDVPSYKSLLSQQLSITDRSKLLGFYPGILLKVGGYVAEPDDMVAVVKENRANDVYGEVFFFYEGLRAYNGDVTQALVDRTVYRDPAPLPFRRASTK